MPARRPQIYSTRAFSPMAALESMGMNVDGTVTLYCDDGMIKQKYDSFPD